MAFYFLLIAIAANALALVGMHYMDRNGGVDRAYFQAKEIK